MSEPIGNPEQLPIAWVYPEFMKNIKDAKCWTAYATYHKDRPIPLYAHPQRELSDEEIYQELKKHINSDDDGQTFKYKNFARAIIKASRGD